MTEELLALSSQDLAGLVPMTEAIETQRAAFAALSDHVALLGPRVLLPGEDAAVAFSYAARMSPSSAPVSKFGSVMPGNPARGLPSVGAIVTALDADTGRPVAVLEGESVTNLRTVAASALAASIIAPRARTLAIIGWGIQGREHARVLSSVLGTDEVRVFARRRPADALDAETTGELVWADTARDAVTGADLVVTCTTSLDPVVEQAWLAPGAAVLTVGSFAPQRREVGDDVVAGRFVLVDDVDAATRQAGPIVAAIESGLLDPAHLVAIGDVITGRASLPADRPILYSSVGVGIQDAAIVEVILARARERGIGTRLPW